MAAAFAISVHPPPMNYSRLLTSKPWFETNLMCAFALRVTPGGKMRHGAG
jgi:hypothetical protein